MRHGEIDGTSRFRGAQEIGAPQAHRRNEPHAKTLEVAKKKLNVFFASLHETKYVAVASGVAINLIARRE
jgi:hypothetical protein